MTLDYIAFFADDALKQIMEEMDWSNGPAIDALFQKIESDSLLRVWGDTTEAWPLNAITEWLKIRCDLPNFGSELGRVLLTRCDYVHFVLPPEDIAKVNAKLQHVDAETDPDFDFTIEEFFSELGSEYVDGYLSDGMSEFYRIYNELKKDLSENADKTLFILIPG